ncbi:MAG TPA: hypothetical protein VGH28_08770 [Polyangiaceae bacterium]|jgi:hypothetical protein
MRTRIGLGFAALFLATAACSNSIFVGSDAGGDEDGGVVPVNGGGDASSPVDAAPPPNCDTTKLPTDDKCVVNDAEGIFVSRSMGKAGGNGSQESPLASLDAAITMAKQAGRRVYACAETYPEQVHFADGVSMFGYFVCGSAWTIDTSKHAKVAAPASPAASAANITTLTRVEAIDVYAPDLTTGSQSSIALLATSSPALTFKGATIHAGTGGKGADGTNGVQLTDSGSAKNGKNARGFDVCNGAIGHCLGPVPESLAGGTNACVGEAGHDPGQGGAGGWDGRFLSQFSSTYLVYEWAVNGQDSTYGFPSVGTSATTQGGSWGISPVNGAAGANGTDGASGGSFGTLSASGYGTADGTAGSDAAPGQGGGGAAGQGMQNSMANANSYENVGAHGESGASGGAGGCPGLAGTSGKGGGASIAVVAIASAFTLDTVTIETSAGGAGGAAGNGSANTKGGTGGAAVQYTVHAANGGDGGIAGVSGNGGGGPSIGIAYQGTAPTQLASKITVGSGGSGVAASTDTGSGKTIPASASGVSVNSYAF